jgi:predicted enzyme related to lactoylglutathione lyase
MMPNPVMHFQIATRQPEAAAEFYRQLFEWKLSAIPGMGYHMIETEPRQGIPGGLSDARATDPIEVCFYVQVPDVQAALDKAQSLGATITQAKLQVTPEIVIAMFKDLEGNSIGLMHDTQVQAALEAPVAALKATPEAKPKSKPKAKPKPKPSKAGKPGKKKARKR